MTNIINEFTVDTLYTQEFELHFFHAYSEDIPLAGTDVMTPWNAAVVTDTLLILPAGGYAVIDSAVLAGSFFLEPDTGYLEVQLDYYFWDCIEYPFAHEYWGIVPVPEPGASVAKYCVEIMLYGSPTPIFDWYIDHTPTLGSENDDYHGCCISGCVHHDGNPYEGAMVRASCMENIIDPGPFYEECTTYTASDGTYCLDSLLPSKYVVIAWIPGHPFMSQGTERLYAYEPATNVNFYLSGIAEYDFATTEPTLTIVPNPFTTLTTVSFRIGQGAKHIELRVYDAAGRLVKDFSGSVPQAPDAMQISWDGSDYSGRRVSSGVYIAECKTDKYTDTKKVLFLQ